MTKDLSNSPKFGSSTKIDTKDEPPGCGFIGILSPHAAKAVVAIVESTARINVKQIIAITLTLRNDVRLGTNAN